MPVTTDFTIWVERLNVRTALPALRWQNQMALLSGAQARPSICPSAALGPISSLSVLDPFPATVVTMYSLAGFFL